MTDLTTPLPEQVTAAIHALQDAGITNAQAFDELLTLAATPPPDPEPTSEPAEAAYAKEVLSARLAVLADVAGLSIGVDVDPGGWADVLVGRLLAHGLDLPAGWADRPAGAALHDGWPVA
ncbi:MAG: hypothetical protein JWP31_1819 [Aeromicrobium sp.]|nr:hypothetical protein [Aeromicrobium sp.]